MSFSFLVNPASGGGAAAGAVVPVARLLRNAGAEVEVSYSPGPSATRTLVAAAVARGDVVVSVGGDGMLSSLAGEVSRLGGVLGVLPAGRGNDFARMLALPATPEAQAALLLSGRTRQVDVLGCGDRVVVGSVYAGVDARAAELVGRWRRLPRRLHYPAAAVRALAGYRPGRYRLVVDGVAQEVEAATVVVANSAYYGRGMRIAPTASVSDGLLDVVVVEAASRQALVRALPSVYDGSHVRAGRGPRPHRLTGGAVGHRGRCDPPRRRRRAAGLPPSRPRRPARRRGPPLGAHRPGALRPVPPNRGVPRRTPVPMDQDERVFPQLPPGFRFGTSTAAFQIEGAADEDGKGPSIWDTFSAQPGRIADGRTAQVACDHYHRWPEDVALLKQLGAGGYRFSVSWPRVLPEGQGRVNERGLDFYDRLVDGLLEAGIKPMVTLYHWDLPQALQDRGGWIHRDTIDHFAAYAELVGRRLGDRVEHWVPINEPNVVSLLGHGLGTHAPGHAALLRRALGGPPPAGGPRPGRRSRCARPVRPASAAPTTTRRSGRRATATPTWAPPSSSTRSGTAPTSRRCCSGATPPTWSR